MKNVIDYNKEELQHLNEELQNFGLKNTILTVKSNASEKLDILKNDILNEVDKNDKSNEKIIDLEQKLANNKFENNQLFKESKIIFPKLNAITVSNNQFAEGDSLVERTVLIYVAKEKLTDDEEAKLKFWIESRLNKENVEIFK